MTDQEYKIQLANHTNFYQKQKDVATRLEKAIVERFVERFQNPDRYVVIIMQEVNKELININESESMGRPNAPSYYRANND